MKNWLIGIIAVLGIVILVMGKQVEYANRNWKTSEANVKAYASMFDGSSKKNAALQLTVEQLEYFNDSVIQELNATRKELKIKDKNLKALQKVSSTFVVRDTVVFRDTLFREPSLAVDTTLTDKWYSVGLGLRYPSTITVTPSFRSEKHIVVSTKKETVNPPKKCFILRWFQKKHLVLTVDVVEKNPYVTDESSRYIEIIKQ